MIKANGKLRNLILLSCVLVLLSGCTLIPKEEAVMQPPLVTPEKETYTTTLVTRGPIANEIKGIAIFESKHVEYHEFNGQNGKIISINVKSGDTVKKGDVLIELEASGLDVNLKERLRDLEVAKNDVAQAKKNRDPEAMKISLMNQDIAQIQLGNAQQLIKDKRLVAKMDGIVIYVADAKPGDDVTPNNSYVDIADPTKMWLSYQGSSTIIQQAQVGMKVDASYKDAIVQGTIVQTPSSAPKTDNKMLTQKYAKTLYINMDQLPPYVLIGDDVQITIPVEKKDDVLKIDRKALQTYLGRNYVKILDGNDVIESDVEVGIKSPSEVEIVKGLNEGQRVIIP